MNHFEIKDGALHAENVPLSKIAKDIGTPVYVYSAATFTRHYHAYADACDNTGANTDDSMDSLIAYSVKANSNLAVLSLLGKLGAGADVVSGGELQRALQAGIPAEKIVFSGVGKSKDEMRAALSAGIFQFNVESRSELRTLNQVAGDMGLIAPVAIRINPDVDAGGHAKISTGKAENKFGIDIKIARQVYKTIAELPHVKALGVDMHIGSQIDSLAPFEKAIDKLLTLISELRADGHDIERFDVGGGLGISYDPSKPDAAQKAPPLPAAYVAMVTHKTKGQNLKMIFEPGRSIAGNAGVLLSKIRYIKSGGARNFIILDAAMNDLIRPALYNASHALEPVHPKTQTPIPPSKTYDIVGPVCETGDTFAVGSKLPEMAEGDLVILRSAGAYGAVQASEYNTRPLIPEVLVSGDKYALIRKRPTVAQILARETIPDWV